MRLLFALALTASGAAYADNTALRNWFDDPFFQIADTMPGCPVPLGPLLTDTEMKAESHARAERGTSCWLSGACVEPNAYRYDAEIARYIRKHVTVHGAASLWITVKRRFVWIEGCVERREQASDMESRLKDVPDVERVFADVMTGVEGSPPYRRAPAARR
ncbi:transporter [Noviherbaspirillum sp. ST9]|uniref:transporter n=1 Tax=Noviherbaspirillum sp. ST9 TaxID=3401606 RepID=UPI003B586DA1